MKPQIPKATANVHFAGRRQRADAQAEQAPNKGTSKRDPKRTQTPNNEQRQIHKLTKLQNNTQTNEKEAHQIASINKNAQE